MAWQSKSLREHVTDAVRAFNAYLPGADAALARNNLKPVAKIIGGAKFELEKFAAWSSDQKFILTCDESLLPRHGAEMKPAVPLKDASPAKGPVTVTATTAISLATGALLTRSDGAIFSVDAGIVLGGAGTSTVQVTAVLAGAAGATDAAAVLTISSGLTGSATFAVAADGLGGAADREAGPAYRARLLFAKAFPDHAGAPADWLRYTLAVPGVTRAFIEPLGQGRGTVVVYPFFDLTRPNGIPLESDRAAVLSALLVSGPGAALPVVRIPQAVPIPMIVQNLSPATPEVQAAAAAEIATTFFRNSRVAGLADPHPSMPFLATPAAFSRSWIWQAIANASGEQSHVLVSPTTDQALTPGQTAVPGPLTFA
ncbi:baseplate J/gp47 family protein [Bosea sp. LjRoot9]|uniref:baseplate J/gp47 family protein n=1 Tax=Bosea sp. LjRoot9 TaxID=3342341 RepID=UPI003ECC99D7